MLKGVSKTTLTEGVGSDESQIYMTSFMSQVSPVFNAVVTVSIDLKNKINQVVFPLDYFNLTLYPFHTMEYSSFGSF